MPSIGAFLAELVAWTSPEPVEPEGRQLFAHPFAVHVQRPGFRGPAIAPATPAGIPAAWPDQPAGQRAGSPWAMIVDERPDGDDEIDWNGAWRQFSKTDGSATLTSTTDEDLDTPDTLPRTDEDELPGGEDFLTYSVSEEELGEGAGIADQIALLTSKYAAREQTDREQLQKMEPKSAQPVKSIAQYKAEREGRAKPAAQADSSQESGGGVSRMSVISAGLSVSLSAYVYVARPALAVAAPASGAAFGLGLYAAVGLLSAVGRRIFAAPA